MNLTGERLRRLRWWAGAIVVTGTAATISLEIAAGRADEAGFSILLLSFPAVGFFVLGRRPDAPLAWLMVSMGLFQAVLGPISAYGMYAVEHDLPFGPLALALGGPGWVPFIGVSGFVLLLFPDGHLPSRRWRWFAWVCGIGLSLVFVLICFHPGNFADSGYPEIQNPIGVDALESLEAVFGFLLLSAPLLVLGGFVSLVVRMRRTTDEVVRHQIRWLAYAASLMALFFVASFAPGLGTDAWDSWIQNLGALSFMLIPVATGIAILRYRLYDIDVVIRKTLVFAVMAAVIALVYVGVVVGVGALVGSSGDPILSALAAAVVALLFQPVRARARRLADRVVYGTRATPYEVMATFGDQLAETYSSEDVLARIARVLAEGIGADRARVWLQVGDDRRKVATWPIGEEDEERVDDFTTDVRHHGELLGALSVAMPPSDPMNPAREKLVSDLAAQAGLVLRNERLTTALKARLVDLQAAQRRLVAAQDHERRKLERNIHDGAQQQLVALAVKARLARSLTERSPERVAEMLAQIEAETQTALEDLRDLARGIYPPLLADKGLEAALTAQARKSLVPVDVRADGIDRFPQEIEAAVYFSTLEALQNVSKYAEASRATVTLQRRNGSLAFSVADDGQGFDLGTTGYGTGLQGIADRLGALDGALEVASRPGSGTTVSGRLPVAGQQHGGTRVTT